MKIAIASDHAGFRLKEGLKAFFERNNIDYIDFGTDSTASVDYPDFAKKVVDCIRNGCADFGVLICGTGLGMSMAANRFKGIRAALCFLKWHVLHERIIMPTYWYFLEDSWELNSLSGYCLLSWKQNLKVEDTRGELENWRIMDHEDSLYTRT